MTGPSSTEPTRGRPDQVSSVYAGRAAPDLARRPTEKPLINFLNELATLAASSRRDRSFGDLVADGSQSSSPPSYLVEADDLAVSIGVRC